MIVMIIIFSAIIGGVVGGVIGNKQGAERAYANGYVFFTILVVNMADFAVLLRQPYGLMLYLQLLIPILLHCQLDIINFLLTNHMKSNNAFQIRTNLDLPGVVWISHI